LTSHKSLDWQLEESIQPPSSDLNVLTVGHSTGEPEKLASRLRERGIDVLVDVRSHPSSAHAPQFNEGSLGGLLASYGIRYVPMGDELGGRPAGPGMYDKDGRVQYDRLAATPSFQAGIGRLLKGCREHRIVIMCSEEDPTNCHRRLLIGRVIRDLGVTVRHLRGDGSIETEEQVSAIERATYPERYQQQLFGEEIEWKSFRSVSAATPRPNSSRS